MANKHLKFPKERGIRYGVEPSWNRRSVVYHGYILYDDTGLISSASWQSYDLISGAQDECLRRSQPRKPTTWPCLPPRRPTPRSMRPSSAPWAQLRPSSLVVSSVPFWGFKYFLREPKIRSVLYKFNTFLGKTIKVITILPWDNSTLTCYLSGC